MSNFNLNNNDNPFSIDDDNEVIKPPKRKRLPNRTIGETMDHLNIKRDCIFNDSRFEDNLSECTSRFGTEIGVKMAYEVDVIEEECRQKYVDEINSLTTKAKRLEASLNAAKYISDLRREKLDTLTKRLGFKEDVSFNDFNEELNKHIESYNLANENFTSIASAAYKAIDQRNDAQTENIALRNEIKGLKADNASIIDAATTKRIAQDAYIEKMKATTNAANAASHLSKLQYEELLTKVANYVAYVGSTNAYDLTQAFTAEILGFSEATISRWANRDL